MRVAMSLYMMCLWVHLLQASDEGHEWHFLSTDVLEDEHDSLQCDFDRSLANQLSPEEIQWADQFFSDVLIHGGGKEGLASRGKKRKWSLCHETPQKRKKVRTLGLMGFESRYERDKNLYYLFHHFIWNAPLPLPKMKKLLQPHQIDVKQFQAWVKNRRYCALKRELYSCLNGFTQLDAALFAAYANTSAVIEFYKEIAQTSTIPTPKEIENRAKSLRVSSELLLKWVCEKVEIQRQNLILEG